jgi:hypothetical protein
MGVTASMFGALAFLGFLMLAVHTVVGLYATTVLKAASWDAARTAALAQQPSSSAISTGDGTADHTSAEQVLQRRLTGFRHVTIQWLDGPDGNVGVSIAVDRPMLLPRGLVDDERVTRIHHTTWARQESVR